MKKIKIGLIGLGTIGAGVWKVLSKRRSLFRQKYGLDLVIAKTCDKNPQAGRKLGINSTLFTTDYRKIIKDDSIDLVIELIGGINPAKKIIFEALAAGKKVVTANKALLSEELPDVLRAAKKSKSLIRFEASVCGGIPIIKSLTEGLIANRIDSIFGIMNGTSNYILSRMAEKGYTFSEALYRAKKRGFAESNPALDINGLDSAHKLVVLVYLAFGKFVSLDQIYVKGIKEITPLDIQYAKDLGLVIKLLAIAKRSDKNVLEMRVHPTLIAEDHPLASVGGVFNAAYVRGDLVGDLLFFGRGAGQMPTASAVVSDVISVVSGESLVIHKQMASVASVKRMQNIQSKYYIRFMVADKPGVLARIGGILAKQNISISSVNQKERRGPNHKMVPVVMLTHWAKEKNIKAAIDAISNLSSTRKVAVIHREDI